MNQIIALGTFSFQSIHHSNHDCWLHGDLAVVDGHDGICDESQTRSMVNVSNTRH